MEVFKHEKDLGLEQEILSQGSVSVVLDAIDVANNVRLEKATAQVIPDRPSTNDLMSVSAILVSTNWNSNDDIFIPTETWAARYTPLFKPANKGHLGRESVKSNLTFGVISSTSILDANLDPINTYPGDEKVPPYFHIMINMYLWEKYFPTIAEEMKTKISSNEMFVSMECFFTGFDYGLKNAEGELMIVPRNDASSWMSKSLRAYKGTGTVKIDDKEYKIGRVLRNINFSGVGFVEKPANPESIIFKDYISFGSAKASFQISFADKQKESVLFLSKGKKQICL